MMIRAFINCVISMSCLQFTYLYAVPHLCETANTLHSFGG